MIIDSFRKVALSAAVIGEAVATIGWQVQVHDCLPSTNRTAKELAALGAPEGTVIIAASQTEGRGRLGRSFCSPPDTGLYMSVILRPTLPIEQARLLTAAAAVAVCRAVETCADVAPQIKWVNDIYCRSRKVCGILTEAEIDAPNGTLAWAVLGIGINVRLPRDGFPPEVAAVAGALFDGEEGVDRNAVASAVLCAVADEYAHMASGRFIEDYRRRSVLNGRRVTVTTPCSEKAATALEVDEACRLRVRYDDGREEALSSGDVSIRLSE